MKLGIRKLLKDYDELELLAGTMVLVDATSIDTSPDKMEILAILERRSAPQMPLFTGDCVKPDPSEVIDYLYDTDAPEQISDEDTSWDELAPEPGDDVVSTEGTLSESDFEEDEHDVDLSEAVEAEKPEDDDANGFF